ncbi:GNAT family N-acetyltransferase [Flaviaesturariibacter aridisoli]|uniref:GNAT family N-acetyltransferase n=1 Tax=Flaviaesturariibacter aridisoli TaxID=2545761 RepID=A0A4R4E032_9BACT|nr:GNAT family N-acetyltransferase [Flaviaesturariibacter aridisoli]TCZ67182.1 GNAT family N-acetyltransferase [Flaviaesturariibacter aridisoli]
MLTFTLKPFTALAPTELYALLRLRSEVFVVEQHCVFLDMDNQDQGSLHLMGWFDRLTMPGQDRYLAAYTRLVPPGQIYAEASIGRVVTSPQARGGGIGRLLMEESIRRCTEAFGPGPIRIGAQQYLERFYSSLGFVTVSEPYMEDGIPHLYMLRSVKIR